MVDTSLLHVDNVNKDNEKCLYNSIVPTNNKIDDGIIIVVTTPATNRDDDDDVFFKKSLWTKVMIIISAAVVVLGFVVTYYSTTSSFIGDNSNNNNNNLLSTTASVDMIEWRKVDGCNIASDTYKDAGGRTVDTKNPFELCFQFGNTDSFCWSKSRYDDGWLYNSWEGCYPCGYNGYRYYKFDEFWHGTSGRGNNNCGQPCTEFCPPEDDTGCPGGQQFGNLVPC